VSKQHVLGPAEHVKTPQCKPRSVKSKLSDGQSTLEMPDSMQTMLRKRLWQALAEQGNAGKG
jgi:hypothetical protein